MLAAIPLPLKLPKKRNQSLRWRSPAHCNHVRAHECSIPGCTSDTPTEVAHVRMGSGAGMGQKPDDWRTVSLCRDCHRRQHNVGEPSFWRGFDIEGLIQGFINTSSKRAEIERVQRERANG